MSLLSPPLDEEEHDGMSSSFSEMEEDEEFVHLDSDDSEKDCMIATVAGDDRRRSTLTIPSSLSLTLTLSSSMMALSRLIVVFAAMISSSQPTPRQKEGRERGMESVDRCWYYPFVDADRLLNGASPFVNRHFRKNYL